MNERLTLVWGYANSEFDFKDTASSGAIDSFGATGELTTTTTSSSSSSSSAATSSLVALIVVGFIQNFGPLS